MSELVAVIARPQGRAGLVRWPLMTLGLLGLAVFGLLTLYAAGRIYLGEHWPSDVVAGLALGLGWTALALSIRPLSNPSLARSR